MHMHMHTIRMRIHRTMSVQLPTGGVGVKPQNQKHLQDSSRQIFLAIFDRLGRRRGIPAAISGSSAGAACPALSPSDAEARRRLLEPTAKLHRRRCLFDHGSVQRKQGGPVHGASLALLRRAVWRR